MQKRSKNKIISIITVLAILLSVCFMFASCKNEGDKEEVTLKYSIKITDDKGDPICNLENIEITGTDISIADATKNACEILEIEVVVESDDTISQIGSLKNLTAVVASDETGEPETNENGEEVTTEETEPDYYYWEVWVNDPTATKDPVSTKTLLKEGDVITWKWILWVAPEK